MGILAIGLANAQTGRVGINTESPSATLNVKTINDTTTPNNLELVNQNGTKLLTMTNAGRLGLLNASPEYLLDIKGHQGDNYHNSSVALRVFRSSGNSGTYSILRSRGTWDTPTATVKEDNIGGILFAGHTGNKYLNSFMILNTITGDVSETDVPSSLRFVRYHNNETIEYPLTIYHTGNIGINRTNPTVALEIVANKDTNPQAQKDNGKTEAIFVDLYSGVPMHPTTKEQRVTISGGMKALSPNYRSHGIDFGLIGLDTATRPFMAFSVAPFQGYPSNEDKTIEHMRIMHTGNIGMGTTNPTEKLQVEGKIKARNVIFTDIPIYANDTEAGAGGLVAGEMYKTATGELRIKL